MSRVPLVALAAAAWLACTTREPEAESYFDRTISPILTTSCSRSPAGSNCHVADARGNAFGNLDTSAYDNVAKRRDLLVTYGAYPQPGLLLKALPPMAVDVRAYDGTSTVVTTDIKHAGGSIFDPAGSAFRVLSRWIDSGATRNNTGRPPAKHASLPCRRGTPASSHDLTVDPPGADYPYFREEVHPVLRARCADGNCHGSESNDLQIACGDGAEDVRATYWIAADYLARTPEQGELLRRPLPPAAGGTFHEGGAIFEGPGDSDYAKLLEWSRRHGPPETEDAGPGFTFFAQRVQPVLVRKGCMQLQCHSASSFHDYRLRGGSSGSFSLSATRRNYRLSLEQLALESDDVRASRLVRKNLFRSEAVASAPGIVHRGGALFEDLPGPTANPAECDAKGYDYDAGAIDDIPALCIVREWLRRERAVRPAAPLTAVVYVRRELTASRGDVLDFDTYAPGSDLRIVTVGASLEATDDRSLSAACGLVPATADIKRPAVSWDGAKIAFGARIGADAPLSIYEMNADGTGCAPIAELAAHDPKGNGLFIHDFDPAYSPPLPGGGHAIVFASTRGNLDPAPYDYAGPQRTPADPSRPNANLYVWEPDPRDPTKHRIRQLTYVLNTERAPSFMSDGRVVFTVEKRLPGFSQIALRRINLDGGDYHPLYGQRSSIGYGEVSQVVQLADKNFAAIFAERGKPGALGIFNRSMGVDLRSTDARDYPADPSVVDPASPRAADPSFFLHSLRMPDAQATGAYLSPAPLPDARVLVSWAIDGDYDVYVVDPATGSRTRVAGAPGKVDVEAVAVYGRPPPVKMLRSAPGEPNCYGIDESRPSADVLMNDADVILSLMTQNTPLGRAVDPALRSFEIWEDLPPPPDVTSMDRGGAFVARDRYGSVYVRRRLIGSVPVRDDRSARFAVPGGVPFVIKLAETPLSTERKLPRVVAEHMAFGPGEAVHEGFPRDAFDGFCAGCHGSISGKPLDAALVPDVLSRASDTAAFREPPTSLVVAPSGRGASVGP